MAASPEATTTTTTPPLQPPLPPPAAAPPPESPVPPPATPPPTPDATVTAHPGAAPGSPSALSQPPLPERHGPAPPARAHRQQRHFIRGERGLAEPTARRPQRPRQTALAPFPEPRAVAVAEAGVSPLGGEQGRPRAHHHVERAQREGPRVFTTGLCYSKATLAEIIGGPPALL